MTACGGECRFVLGSDLRRDGMYFEMTEADGTPVAEVFYSDATGCKVVTRYEPCLPSEAVERPLSMAKPRLPSAKRGGAVARA